jgi:hypothetical protein
MPIKYINNNNNPITGQGVQNAIFGYGNSSGQVSMTNIVSNTGIVSNDVTGVGSTRELLAAAGYGGDKAIFGYGISSVAGGFTAITNLVSNTGVVATDTTGVGTGRRLLAAATYGSDKAIFGYGNTFDINNNQIEVSITNLVSNTGVVASDTTGVGTVRKGLAAAGYGGDKAIFGYGDNNVGAGNVSKTNLVTNTGVVGNDVTGVGTARSGLAAASYGGDKAIFGYGYVAPSHLSMTNTVSNTGVVLSDTTGVGTARYLLAASSYGGDKAIFGYGSAGPAYSITNRVNNSGVVSTDTTGVGTARNGLAAAGFSTTAPAVPKMNFINRNNNTSNRRMGFIIPPGPVVYSPTQRAIFGYGEAGSYQSVTNLVSNTGVLANDVAGVGTARAYLGAAGYGGDKAIFAYGVVAGTTNIKNLVSNTGVVANDSSGVGTSRNKLGAVSYGIDKAIFGYGSTVFGNPSASERVSMTNLVSNTGVVATDTTGVGSSRYNLAATGYGGDKAMFVYGQSDSNNTALLTVNLVSNTGVVASDTSAAAGTAKTQGAGANYGGDKGIIGFGIADSSYKRETNLVSNTGVIASNTANYYGYIGGVNDVLERSWLAAAGYGGDKAIFGFGALNASRYSYTNLVSNTGVVASNTYNSNPTARYGLAAAGYSLT